MTTRSMTHDGARGAAQRAGAAFLFGLVAGSPPPAAAALPVVREGLWEFTRTVVEPERGHAQTRRECTSPLEALRRRLDELARKGCTISERSLSATRYEIATRCEEPKGSLLRDTLVIEMKGLDAYSQSNELHRTSKGGVVTRRKDETVAKRLQDCPTPPPARDARPGSSGNESY